MLARVLQALYKNQEESAEMKCLHNLPNYNTILWYKQDGHRQLILLGYMIGGSGFTEAGFDIALEGDANAGATSTLTIRELTPDSSARSVGDTALKLIAYVFLTTQTVEPSYKGYFDVKGDGRKDAFLQLLKLRQAEDSGEYFCAASFSLGVEVHQTPSEVFNRPGENVQLFCHHKTSNYRVMLWYQKLQGETALKLIGYLHFPESNH
ncbi:unnamed protein product [Coregonus sp. 'balchen']|nr:unnamed protein product [Coregonus sp. 'balchen']